GKPLHSACRDSFSTGDFSGTVCFCRPQRENLHPFDNHVLDSMLLFAVLCSVELLETIPCRSSRECPFLSCLRPCDSGITSWKHRTIAHPPVHPAIPHAQLKRCHSEDHKIIESVLRTSAPLLLNSA
ncbi:hypothetical protein CHARACLAT_028131, partial [Characodon lateralis]|nr:hypothetical protein [Characodon lateralis]